MKNKKKKMLITSILLCVFSIGFIISYAFFSFDGQTNKYINVGGMLSMFLNDGNQITLSGNNAYPMNRQQAYSISNNFMSFTISTENSTDKDIYFDITLEYGDEVEGKTRIDDKYLKFEMYRRKSGNITSYSFINQSFDSIDNKLVYSNKISPETSTTNYYRYKEDYDKDVCFNVLKSSRISDETDTLEINNLRDFCNGDGSYFSYNELTEWNLNHKDYLQTLIDLGWNFSYVTVDDDDGKIVTDDEDAVSACVSGFESNYGTNTMWDSFCRGTSDAGQYSNFTITDYLNGNVSFLGDPYEEEIDYLIDKNIITGTKGNYTLNMSKTKECLEFYYYKSSKIMDNIGSFWSFSGTDYYNFSNNLSIGPLNTMKYYFEYEIKYWGYSWISINQSERDELYNQGVLEFDYTYTEPSATSITYYLRMWISDEVTIGDENCTYTQEEWNNLFASVKVSVHGDFTENTEIDYNYPAYYILKGSNVVKDNQSSTYVTSSSGIDFTSPSSTTNGYGVYYISATTSNDYPEYYVRGITKKVIFANYCWDVVKSTDTGGIKLLYSGVPTNGKCLTSSSIGTSKYNEKSNSMAYVGYYYGENIEQVYLNKNDYSGNLAKNHYAEEVKYINGEYTLINGSMLEVNETWDTSYPLSITAGVRYTCLTTGDTCEDVYYVMETDENGLYYLKLSDGEKIEEAINRMTSYSSNETPSTIATYLNEWYEDNLLSYSDLIEDSTYCNYRKDNNLYEIFRSSAKNYRTPGSFYYGINTPTSYATCPNNDSFTVDASVDIGYLNHYTNGALKYPIGLLTFNEAIMMGIKSSTNTFWTMTPHNYNYEGNATVKVVSNTSTDFFNSYSNVDEELDVRPVITVKFDAVVKSGTGTESDPYIIG